MLSGMIRSCPLRISGPERPFRFMMACTAARVSVSFFFTDTAIFHRLSPESATTTFSPGPGGAGSTKAAWERTNERPVKKMEQASTKTKARRQLRHAEGPVSETVSLRCFRRAPARSAGLPVPVLLPVPMFVPEESTQQSDTISATPNFCSDRSITRTNVCFKGFSNICSSGTDVCANQSSVLQWKTKKTGRCLFVQNIQGGCSMPKMSQRQQAILDFIKA